MRIQILSVVFVLSTLASATPPEKKPVANATTPSKKHVDAQKTAGKQATVPAKQKPMDPSLKLKRFEAGLETIVGKAGAPEGAEAVLKDVKKAEGEVASAKTESEKSAIMKNISGEIDTFKSKLLLRKKQLEAADKAEALNITVPKAPSHQEPVEQITKEIRKRTNLTDDVAKSLSPIVRQLQGRLDSIDYQERKREASQKELEKSEEKMAASPLHKQGDKEAAKAQKLMNYLKKKTQRQFKKKQVQWKNEKKALNDAISAIMDGKISKLQAAMDLLNQVHKPGQDFLH